MSESKKISLREKEQKLLEKITKAKQELSKLRKKRAIECGEMVMKHGLDQFEDQVLDTEFKLLSEKLANEHA